MAQSFSVKKYLSKLHAHTLLNELAEKHGSSILLDINDQTPRKLAVQMMEESIKSLATEPRLSVTRDLSYVSSITNPHTASLGKKLFKEKHGKEFEPEIECASDTDVVLYFFLRHEEISDSLALLSPFYASKNYFAYEAKNVEQAAAEMKMTELDREFTRLANKDDHATDQHMEYLFLNGVWHITSTFHEGYATENKLTHDGETDRKHVARKVQSVRIAYIPEEEIVLIAGTIAKNQKLNFLETFLRIVTDGGYEQKVEQFNLSPLQDLSFDFSNHNKQTPFLKASIKSATISYADGKKKLRLTLPNSREHANLSSLKETIEELGLHERFASFTIINMTFGFVFQDKEREGKTVQVSCSLSPTKATLCPLFEYDRYAKSILKNAGIYEGFTLIEN